MNKTSAKNKIIMLVIVWVVGSAAMLFYFFGFLDASNRQIVSGMQKQKQVLTVLQGQKQNFDLAQEDLEKLAQQPLQPGDFFSKDITLVDEIQTLENWNRKLGVNMQLSGLSGTVGSEPSANTLTPIAEIPYTISISGTLSQVVNFLQVLENLGFVTNINGIQVSAGAKNTVNANLSANFYLRK